MWNYILKLENIGGNMYTLGIQLEGKEAIIMTKNRIEIGNEKNMIAPTRIG